MKLKEPIAKLKKRELYIASVTKKKDSRIYKINSPNRLTKPRGNGR